jgi:hypothetical protein
VRKTVEEKLAMLLYRCANGAAYRIVGSEFDCCLATVHRTLYDVGKAVVRHFGNVVRLPQTEMEAIQNVRDFEEDYRIPFMAAAMDGTYIPINSASEDKAAHYCHKSYKAFIIHAIVNAR